jgi:hypothetical protein
MNLQVFGSFYIVIYFQVCIAPEDESNLLSKRRVCAISEGWKSPNTHQ